MRKVFPPSPPETPRSGLRPLRIRELGAAVGVEVETIRYYEKAGLLPSPVRSDNGYRAYGQEHVQRLAFIRHCRSLDMSLADVTQLLGLMDNPAADGAVVDALVQQQIARVRMRLTSLKALEKQLLALQGRCAAPSHGEHLASECPVLHELVVAAKGEACACHADRQEA
ncbi:MAG: Cd(II)/Pb(II)-responsive transcriptional regulator [Brachymonas sp.]